MGVPIYQFGRLHNEKLRQEVLPRLAKIMEENSFIDGSYNASFERRFAEKTKSQHCLLVANGTDALELALEAHGVGHGDKVGIPGITFYATAEAVLNRGATPILIDVDAKTGLMDPASLLRILGDHQLKAIMPVHIYGMPAPIRALEAICKPREIVIIEDAAQAHGATLTDGTPVGGTENLTTFSFYPTKNLGAFGDAGGITMQTNEMKEKLIRLRNHGRDAAGIRFFGRNSRCDHMQAAVLDLKLDYFDAHQENRRTAAKFYIDGLKGLPLEMAGEDHLQTSSWHLFPILLKDSAEKMAIKAHLETAGIGTATFYIKSLGEEIPLMDVPGEKKTSIRFAERVICIPIHPCLEKEELELVVSTIKKFFA